MEYEKDVIVGVETHLSLNKVMTKLFCGCPIPEPDNEPNTRCCEVCLGHPGAKPVTNKKAVEHAIKLALALNSKIQPELIFSRKVYPYMDLVKNFQITQYEIPLGVGGFIQLSSGKKIRLIRVHIEEDPGALIHPAGMQKSSYVLVDYNRSGIPLCEIVTEPDINSPEEAREFMNRLIEIVQYLDISDPAKSAIKADINVSIKESGYVKTEIKNVTGFKEIERALRYEIKRQKKEIEEGKKLKQETRAWDSEKGITFSLRTKETAEDYGYIIETDLVPIELTKNWLNEIKKTIPELAHEKVEKYLLKHKIEETTAKVLAKDKELANVFEAVAASVNPELAAKWVRRELPRVLNFAKKKFSEVDLTEKHLVDLLKLVENKVITDSVAQKILEKLVEKPFDVNEYVKKEKLEAVSDSKELEKICKEAIKDGAKAVEDYKKGNEKALHYVVGVVMKKTKGKATPKDVNEILKKLIKG